MKRLFDHDPVAGLTQYFHYDEAGDRFTIETVADSEPIVENNKRLFNEGRPRGDWNCIASIPPEIILKWRELYGVNIMDRNDWPRIRRLLNDPDWRYLRTAPGVV